MNIRSDAGTSFPIVARAAYGTYLVYLGERSGWYSVQWNGGTGYVSGGSQYTLRGDGTTQSTPSNEESQSPNPRITNHGNGWCSATPAEVGFSGWAWETITQNDAFGRSYEVQLRNPRYQMYFDDETNLGNVQYFVYYNNNYVGPNVAQLEGSAGSENSKRWQFGIDSTWALASEPFWRFENRWRVDYVCD